MPTTTPLSKMNIKGPIRICCGERHLGPVCPDGLVQCCICFSRFEKEDLSTTPDGKKIDVCKPCAMEEKHHRDLKRKKTHAFIHYRKMRQRMAKQHPHGLPPTHKLGPDDEWWDDESPESFVNTDDEE